MTYRLHSVRLQWLHSADMTLELVYYHFLIRAGHCTVYAMAATFSVLPYMQSVSSSSKLKAATSLYITYMYNIVQQLLLSQYIHRHVSCTALEMCYMNQPQIKALWVLLHAHAKCACSIMVCGMYWYCLWFIVVCRQ